MPEYWYMTRLLILIIKTWHIMAIFDVIEKHHAWPRAANIDNQHIILSQTGNAIARS
jgi:hypothetical protein